MIRLCDNMINDDYSKLKYNNKLINYLKIAYTHLESEGYKVVAYKYDWKKQKGTRIYKLNEFEEIKKEKNKWVNYYWIEFEKNEVKYKFSLLYKDFDRKSGNIHVLPGAVQLWKKEKNDYCKLNKMKKEDYAVPFVEDEWYPIFDSESIHYISDEKDLNAILEIIIKKHLEKNKDKIKKPLLGTISEEVNFYTLGGKINNLTSVSEKYKVIMYHSKKENEKTYWKSYYFSEIDKNSLIFPRYGQVQFWRGISASPCSPSEYEEEKGWKLFYPETSNKYKIKGISKWANNIKKGNIKEKDKLKDIINLIITANVKSFDPDINIENQKDMKRLDKDFNEFKRICNIIENNIEQSIEKILKLILGENK